MMIVPSQDFEARNSRSFSNQVLVQNDKNSTRIYYVPVYLRIKLKNINDINLADLCGEINTVIILTIYYGDLDQEVKSYMEQNLELQFNREEALKLQQNLQITFKDKPKQKCMTYTIRKMLAVRLYGQIFWTPFQIISLILTIGVRNINLNTKKGKAKIQFNLMDHKNTMLKLSYQEDIRFGQYFLAPAKMIAECSFKSLSNYQRKKQEQAGIRQKQLKIQNDKQYSLKWQSLSEAEKTIASNIGLMLFEESDALANATLKNVQYGHFIIPLYRRPGVPLLTVFIPLILLGVINLGIFFQEETLGKRFVNITALMVSYVALIPTIREQVPPWPTLTFIQFLVYTEAFTTIICSMQSIQDRNDPNVDQRFTTDWFNNGYLMSSIVITALVFLSIVILYLVHKLVWERQYFDIDQKKADQKFDMMAWKHNVADQYFKRFSSRLQPLQNFASVNSMVQK